MTVFNRFKTLAALLLLIGLAFAGQGDLALAAVSPSPCGGNLCTGTMVVGGQTVRYTYTEHVNPDGQLRVRINGGVYNSPLMISYLLSGLPVFQSWDKLANPNNGAVILPEEDVNPGRTAYERKSSAGFSSEIVDMVMSVDFAGLPAGAYAFNLMVIQNGDAGAQTNIRFYVDAAAPLNDDESHVWPAVSGLDYPCADGRDNDLNFRADCADAKCVGEVAEIIAGTLCESPEATCNDEFDNDADGDPDCADPDCNGQIGEVAGTGRCQYPSESGVTSCSDSFDNDADGRLDCLDNLGATPANRCWKQSAYGCAAVENCATGLDDDRDQSFSNAWDNAPTTGVNCLDYDCFGDSHCPLTEEKRADGQPADDQCFDGLDNDLDTFIDCSDPDCIGAINPSDTGQRCYDKEFDLGMRYQFCSNTFDDDGDFAVDCSDTDCRRRFVDCGPCPEREDYQFDSCGDGIDNDADGLGDCEDPDCTGDLIESINAAFCAADENTDFACSDLADNDGDGLGDCEDPSCAGFTGPDGQVCEEPAELTCDDLKDNDGDGRRDCVDLDCWGVASCAAKNYFDAPCRIVPTWSGLIPFTSNDPTVFANAMLTSHAGTPYQIRFTGSALYDSVTIIVGDNTDPAGYFPYADPTDCEVTDTASGTPAARFGMIAVADHALMLFSTTGPAINTFDVMLTCDTPNVPALPWDYPASASVLRVSGEIPEYGDITLTTELLESVKPIVTEIEPEAESGGWIEIPFGLVTDPQGRRFRVVPEDPDPDSGICSCRLDVNGANMTMGSECVSLSLAFEQDTVAVARARAEDGSGNTGDWSVNYNFNVNVTPAVNDQLKIHPTQPFFRDILGQNQMFIEADFLTGTTDFFDGNCNIYVRTPGGAIVNGPVGPTVTMPGMAIGNAEQCQGWIALPTTMPDGMYFLSVSVTDNDGDSVETERHVIYMCNDVPGPGDSDPGNGCIWADFDRDGAGEGLFTDLFTLDNKSCDNCVGLPNPSQTDVNANGVGDDCEPSRTYGRCEVDRDIVCDCGSDEVCVYQCPGESIKEHPITGLHLNPQPCHRPWGLCTYGGEVCFDDSECLGGPAPGGAGWCADGITACRKEQDCIDAGIGPSAYPSSACEGADICDNLIYPWLQTVYGNMFSRKKVLAPEGPPDSKFNATFCITARDTILNFTSENNCVEVDIAARYTFPKPENDYTTVLGQIDVEGLRAGKYGDVIDVPAGNLDTTIMSFGGRLGGRVLRVTGDVTVSGNIIRNEAAGEDGSGTIFVDGGNLTITGNILYEAAAAETTRSLASLGWIVLDDGTDTRGNLYINRAVTSLAGAFYVGGKDGIWSVAAPDTEGENQLRVYGLMIARQFHFSRSHKSLTEGSEQVIFDGRAVANPPPGFEDLGKYLPRFTDSAP